MAPGSPRKGMVAATAAAARFRWPVARARTSLVRTAQHVSCQEGRTQEDRDGENGSRREVPQEAPQVPSREGTGRGLDVPSR
jgi:hypothetical protein